MDGQSSASALATQGYNALALTGMVLASSLSDAPRVSTIHERIREARLRAGLTQEALAREIGTRAMSISDWERGTRTPKAVHVAAIASVLEVSADWLIHGSETKFGEHVVRDDASTPPAVEAYIKRMKDAVSPEHAAELRTLRLSGGAHSVSERTVMMLHEDLKDRDKGQGPEPVKVVPREGLGTYTPPSKKKA
jgi:transcriptional regulator with XRE-family HTH domain